MIAARNAAFIKVPHSPGYHRAHPYARLGADPDDAAGFARLIAIGIAKWLSVAAAPNVTPD
jgi:hypothetical protein